MDHKDIEALTRLVRLVGLLSRTDPESPEIKVSVAETRDPKTETEDPKAESLHTEASTLLALHVWASKPTPEGTSHTCQVCGARWVTVGPNPPSTGPCLRWSVPGDMMVTVRLGDLRAALVDQETSHTKLSKPGWVKRFETAIKEAEGR